MYALFYFIDDHSEFHDLTDDELLAKIPGYIPIGILLDFSN